MDRKIHVYKCHHFNWLKHVWLIWCYLKYFWKIYLERLIYVWYAAMLLSLHPIANIAQQMCIGSWGLLWLFCTTEKPVHSVSKKPDFQLKGDFLYLPFSLWSFYDLISCLIRKKMWWQELRFYLITKSVRIFGSKCNNNAVC